MKTEQTEFTLLQQVKPGDWVVDRRYSSGKARIVAARRVERLTATQIVCDHGMRLDSNGRCIGGHTTWELGAEAEVKEFHRLKEEAHNKWLQEEAERQRQQSTPEYKAASLIHGHIEHVLRTEGLSKLGMDRLNKIRDALDI